MFVDQRERGVCRLHELPVAEADLNSGSVSASLTDCFSKEGRNGEEGKKLVTFLVIGFLVTDGWMYHQNIKKKKQKETF